MKLIFAFCALLLASSVNAEVRSMSLNWESPIDKRPITGFLMQGDSLPADAPVAILLHAMNTDLYHWIADGVPTYGGKITQLLLDKGYRVVALDARAHGHRKYGLSAEERMNSANNGDQDAYYEMIQNTVKDYEFVLRKINRNFSKAKHTLAVGYSMGGQMAIMLAAQNPQIDHLITMVPPHAGNVKDVSPVLFAPKVNAKWLLFLANKDEYSTPEENKEIAAVAKGDVTLIKYDSGHVLPPSYIDEVTNWVNVIK